MELEKKEYEKIIKTEYTKGLLKMFIAIILCGIIGIKTEIITTIIPEIEKGTITVLSIIIGIIIATFIYMNTEKIIVEMELKLQIVKELEEIKSKIEKN